MKKYFISVLVLFSISCSQGSKKEAPAIYFSNASADKIQNIQVNWVSKNILTLPNLSPGDSRTHTFYIKKNDDFFGDVNVSWSNANGEKMAKNFNIQKIHLPNIEDKHNFNYIQLYFSQNDVEIITSDIVDISGKTKIMDNLMAKYRAEAETRGIYTACIPHRINLFNCPDQGASRSVLIRVQTLE